MKNYLIIGILVSVTLSCTQENMKADLIITNAQIWTANPDHPNAEALAISSDKILAIGSNNEIESYKGSETKVVDAENAFITPGFIDSHVHFITGGQNLSSVQLRDAATKDEFISRIAVFATTQKPGTWLIGGDWDHKLWGGDLPEKEWIDSVTSENPILLNRLDGHMAFANTLALKELEIDGLTKIESGEVELNDNGEPTGILKEDAYYNQLAKLPPFTDEQNEAFAKTAMNYVASHGVTSVHDVNGFADQEIFEKLHKNGDLITRIYSATPLSMWKKLKDKIDTIGRGDEWLKRGGLKGFVDGSLGSHTAAFFDEYSDAPGEKGYFVNTEEELHNWIKGGDAAGLQIFIHAIGDSAIHTLLNIYERVADENGPHDRRFRIEHAQHIAEDDIPRFTELGVIPAMQPYHLIDDGRWAKNVIGQDRLFGTYAFKSLFENNTDVVFGSDWFVAPPIPLMGIYAAVTRRTLDDKNPDGWVPEQKVSVEQALKAYTINGAYASFDEEIKGSLEQGKLADFVILDQNLFTIDPATIRDVKVLKTYVGGKLVYETK